jgi:two-component system chemotaxis response regulator CheB
MQAIGDLLADVDLRADIAVIVAQHRAADAPVGTYVELLQRRIALPVVEASDKDPIEPGHVYIAPADYHLLVDDGELSLTLEAAVRFSRPSIDVLFESAAESYGSRVTAIVLTGANDDGCRGALAVKEAGGRVFAQDPETAERREMPDGVIGSGAVDAVLKIPELAALLNTLGGVRA